jgi:putative ABC transport system permease protein
MNNLYFRLGFRNVRRQRRRSTLNILALGVNTGMLILLIGVLRGFYGMTIQKTIDLQTGHIQIHRVGYADERQRLPLDITVPHADSLRKILDRIPNVVAASPRIEAAALLSNGIDRAPVVLYGVYPSEERKVGVILDGIVEGHTLTDTSDGIVIGKRLATLLKAHVGQSLMIYAQTVHNANNLLDARVEGIFESGFGIADKSVIYASMPVAQRLLDMGDVATEVVIRLHGQVFVTRSIPAITAAAKNVSGDSLLVQPWYDIARDIVAGIKQDMVSYAIIGIILVTLAVFGITNTMTVSVYERTAEIGALRALGMSRKEIRKTFLVEGVVLGIAGALVGAVLGAMLAWYMNVYGIALPAKALEEVAIPIGNKFVASSRAMDWLIGAALAVISALTGAVWPARRASRVPVTVALARGVR